MDTIIPGGHQLVYDTGKYAESGQEYAWGQADLAEEATIHIKNGIHIPVAVGMSRQRTAA
jgi:hypothetical protein